MHIMIDLETMGTSPNAPVFAIGAVRFDENGVTKDTFYQTISLESAVSHGATMEPGTVTWWMQRTEEPRQQLADAAGDMAEALEAFTEWVEADEVSGVWGNGVGFDNTILTQTYRRQGQQPPWEHWQDNCYRTEKNKSPVVMAERKGTHHNALDDAISQAHHLIEIWRHMSAPVLIDLINQELSIHMHPKMEPEDQSELAQHLACTINLHMKEGRE